MIQNIAAQLRHLMSLGPSNALNKVLGAIDLRLLGGRISHACYQRALFRGRVYLGNHLWAYQGNRRRHLWMRQLALSMDRSTRDGLQVLEIGSYAGASAIVWAGAIRDGCSGLGRVVCIDPWAPYLSNSLRQGLSLQLREMDTALAEGRVKQLFHHNVRSAGIEPWIESREGTFGQIFPSLQQAGIRFDVIYLDGDHRYSEVIRDLQRADQLLAKDGIVCGDDLELQLRDADADACRAMREFDFVLDPRSRRLHHPGVTWAVHEFFGGPVSCWDGFWAMARDHEGGWQPLLRPDRH